LIPGLNIDALLDALADKVAQRLREDSAGSVTAVRPRLLTVDQAAVYIGRSKDAVQHMVSSGKVPTIRADRRVFIDVEDLDRWIREHKQCLCVAHDQTRIRKHLSAAETPAGRNRHGAADVVD
jgi:excisionase family DNA binding protein